MEHVTLTEMKLTHCWNMKEVGAGDSHQSTNGAHFYHTHEYTKM